MINQMTGNPEVHRRMEALAYPKDPRNKEHLMAKKQEPVVEIEPVKEIRKPLVL